MSRTAIIPLMLGASAALAATQDDAVLYRYRNETLSTSRYEPIAAFQKALDEKLTDLQAVRPPCHSRRLVRSRHAWPAPGA